MARHETDKLTAVAVRNAKPGRYADGKGLYLLVSDTGARSWLLRIQVGGRRRDIGLGSVNELPLGKARDKARELRTIARTGGDPIAERDRDKIQTIPSFRVAAASFHEASKDGWAPKHAAAWLSSLTAHIFPRIGSMLVNAIDASAVERALQPIWLNKPVIARKLRHRIFAVLNFSKAKGWRDQPAPSDAVRELLKVRSQPKGGNFAAMPFADVPAYVANLRSEPETMGRLALLYTIATVARSGETRSALIKHVDTDTRLWNRPALLMKTRTAHSVTLNDMALAILERAAELRGHSRPDGLIFPGRDGRPLSDMTLSKVLRDDDLTYTVHGFRSAFRDWAAEKMPTMPESVAEAALAHTVSDAVVAAYRRTVFLDMRRTLLEAWGDYLVNVGAPADGR